MEAQSDTMKTWQQNRGERVWNVGDTDVIHASGCVEITSRFPSGAENKDLQILPENNIMLSLHLTDWTKTLHF